MKTRFFFLVVVDKQFNENATEMLFPLWKLVNQLQKQFPYTVWFYCVWPGHLISISSCWEQRVNFISSFSFMQTVKEVSKGSWIVALPGWWSQEDGGIHGLAWVPHRLHWEMQETDLIFLFGNKNGGNNRKSHIWVISYRSSYCGIPSFFLRDFGPLNKHTPNPNSNKTNKCTTREKKNQDLMCEHIGVEG